MLRWGRGLLVVLFVELVAASQAAGGWNQWTTMGPGGSAVSVPVAIDPVTPSTIYTARGNEGAVFKSTDGGAHWTASDAGITAPFITALAVDPHVHTTVYAGTSGFDLWGVFKSTDGGIHWNPSSVGFPPVLDNISSAVTTLVFDPQNPATLYAGTTVGVFKSADAGTSWSAQNDGLLDRWASAFALDPRTPSTLYVATVAGVHKSTDGGAHWTLSDKGLPHLFILQPLPGVASLTVDPHDPATVYAGTVRGVFKSTDGGANWSFSMSGVHFIGSHVSAVAIDPQTPRSLYAATAGAGIYRSTDSAQTWTPFDAGLSDDHLTGVTVSPSGACLHATGLSGVFSLVTRPDPCAAPVNPTISVNESNFEMGQWLTVSVGLLNLGDSGAADIYFGVRIPDDNHTIAFFTSAGTLALGTFDDFTSYRPVATGVPLTSAFATTAPDVFSYRWTGAEPPGAYAFVFYAVQAGALADGNLTTDELLAYATTGFSFASPLNGQRRSR
jgi:photosystem II stability/assembly factor-like uncharacterized protein